MLQSKQLIPLAQLIVVGYDWENNYAMIFPTNSLGSNISGNLGTCASSPDSGSNLLQLLIDTDVQSKANIAAQANGDSALVQLVLLITQTVAASYPISSTGPLSANLNSSVYPSSDLHSLYI